MKKLKMLLPVVAFLFAIAAAFAGNVMSSSMLVEPSKRLSNCGTCTDDVDDNCSTTGTNACRCTISGGTVVAGANASCVELFRN